MRWNIDHISGSPRFLLKPVNYLLFKIKSNKSFSPPLNSTWITLKLNRVESFLSFFIPITFPPTPIAEASPGVILWYVVLLQYCRAYLTHLHSIRKRYWGWKLITWPSPRHLHLHHMVVLNRGGLEGGPKAKKLVVSSSFSTTNPILLSVLSGCWELRL